MSSTKPIQPAPSEPTTNPKVQQFLDEIQEVYDRYQYKLIPTLAYQKNGIVPQISIEEIIPEKKEKPEMTKIKPKKKPMPLMTKIKPKKNGSK